MEPLRDALVRVLPALPPPVALLVAAAAFAVGAEIALSAQLQQIEFGDIFQRVMGLTNLRSVITQIFQQQAARDVAIQFDSTYPVCEAEAFKALNAAALAPGEILLYTEVNYRDELEYIWRAVIVAHSTGVITYLDMSQWVAWANSIPIRPDTPEFTWALGGGPTYVIADDVLPTFSAVETLQAWYDVWAAKYASNAITYVEYIRIYTHYSAEYDRLVAPSVIVVDEVAARLAEIRDKIAALSLSLTLPGGAIKVDVAPALVTVQVQVTELRAALTALVDAIDKRQAQQFDDVAKQLTAALAGLAAAQAAATDKAGAQVATSSQAAAETQAKATTDSGIATAAAITALAGLGVTAFAKIAKTWGHDVASGQRTCWASTAADLFGQIAGAAVPLSLAVAADKFSPIREAMNSLMQRVFDEILGAPELQRPIEPAQAPAVAAALFRKAFELGQAAHLLAVLGEVVTPLKMLGIGQVAAFLADMSGFAKIGGAMMGAIESQALARPFGYYLNAKTLTNRPNTGQLGALASDQAITREEYISEMAYQGYVRQWAEGLYDTTFRALAPRQLQMMAEAGIADDAYFGRELQHSGLRPETIVLVKDQLRLAALGELKPTGQAVALKRYTEGITSEIELRQELDSLGFRAVKLEAAVRLARLSRDTDLLLERITIAVNSYLSDDITEAQLGTQLTSLGFEPERVKIILDRAVQRYRPPKLPDRLPRLREQYANTILNNVELGFATPENISPGLLALGYTSTEARLAIDNAKEIARQATLKDQIAILEDRLTDKEITLDQFRAQLLTLGITPEQVNAHVELNRLRIQPTPKAPELEEIPQLTTAQLLAAYKTEVLSEAVVRAELLERKYQLADIDVLIRLNTAIAKAPTASTIRLATEAELKAWFAAGLISDQETYAGLIARGRSDLDARRIIELELIKAEARLKL